MTSIDILQLETKLGFLSGRSAYKFNSLHRKYGTNP